MKPDVCQQYAPGLHLLWPEADDLFGSTLKIAVKSSYASFSLKKITLYTGY